jgi:hypothetical protein
MRMSSKWAIENLNSVYMSFYSSLNNVNGLPQKNFHHVVNMYTSSPLNSFIFSVRFQIKG